MFDYFRLSYFILYIYVYKKNVFIYKIRITVQFENLFVLMFIHEHIKHLCTFSLSISQFRLHNSLLAYHDSRLLYEKVMVEVSKFQNYYRYVKI